MEVAVAPLPARHRIPRLRIHLHVQAEQVVAALETVLDRLRKEEGRVLALADQPALHVGERTDDGVDRAALDLPAQLFQPDHGVNPPPNGVVLTGHPRTRVNSASNDEEGEQ